LLTAGLVASPPLGDILDDPIRLRPKMHLALVYTF
jgi:hypothetical protein